MYKFPFLYRENVLPILIFQFSYFSAVPETPSDPTTLNNQPDSGAVQVVPETQMTCETVQTSSGEQSSQPSIVCLIQVHVVILTLILFRYFLITCVLKKIPKRTFSFKYVVMKYFPYVTYSVH